MASAAAGGEQESEADGDDGLEAQHPSNPARQTVVRRSHVKRDTRYHMRFDFNETGEVTDHVHFALWLQAGLGRVGLLPSPQTPLPGGAGIHILPVCTRLHRHAITSPTSISCVLRPVPFNSTAVPECPRLSPAFRGMRGGWDAWPVEQEIADRAVHPPHASRQQALRRSGPRAVPVRFRFRREACTPVLELALRPCHDHWLRERACPVSHHGPCVRGQAVHLEVLIGGDDKIWRCSPFRSVLVSQKCSRVIVPALSSDSRSPAASPVVEPFRRGPRSDGPVGR